MTELLNAMLNYFRNCATDLKYGTCNNRKYSAKLQYYGKTSSIKLQYYATNCRNCSIDLHTMAQSVEICSIKLRYYATNYRNCSIDLQYYGTKCRNL